MRWRHDQPTAGPRFYSLIPGIAGAVCASASFVAWVYYSRFAGLGIEAVTKHSLSAAYRFANLADWCRATNFVLGLSAISLGLTVLGHGDRSVLVRGLARYSLIAGALSLAIGMILLV